MARLRSHSSHLPFNGTASGGTASFAAAYNVMPYSRPVYVLPSHQATAVIAPNSMRGASGGATTRGRAATTRGTRATRNTSIVPPS
jgi:hypothetical protein